jgi:hypothetical protein
VQRLLAAILLCVIGFLPVGTAFASAAGTPTLPVCCRAHGKHKCAMLAGSRTAPSIYARCDQYPVLPAVSSSAVNGALFVPGCVGILLWTIGAHLMARAQSESRLILCFERSRLKRGPPSFSS